MTEKHSVTIKCMNKGRKWSEGVEFTDKRRLKNVWTELEKKLDKHNCFDGSFVIITRVNGGYGKNHKSGSTTISNIRCQFDSLKGYVKTILVKRLESKNEW